MKLTNEQEQLVDAVLNGLRAVHDGVLLTSKDESLLKTAKLTEVLHDDLMRKLGIKGKMFNFNRISKCFDKE